MKVPVLALLAAALLSACSSPSSTVSPSATPPTGATAGSTRASQGPIPAGAVQARVTRVVDGDTVVVEIPGRGEERVRYIGINTPESADPRRPVEYYGEEASARNKELVEGKAVFLEKDVSETDRYGRLLRYVYLADGTMINEELVRQGFSQAVSYPPDLKHQERLRQAEREARTKARGLWAPVEVYPFEPPPSPTP